MKGVGCWLHSGHSVWVTLLATSLRCLSEVQSGLGSAGVISGYLREPGLSLPHTLGAWESSNAKQRQSDAKTLKLPVALMSYDITGMGKLHEEDLTPGSV